MGLDDGLLADAKALVARERLTLTRFMEEGLALRLRRSSAPLEAAGILSLATLRSVCVAPTPSGRGPGLSRSDDRVLMPVLPSHRA